ncbi:hypothetical protein AN641_03520 [Candidatus Epulonipiscioides gigas]|nr:hypothetical protein AN641_03520 [Epulopiscium sp. SCG-C07WGA-EpuloA2]
MKLRLKSLLYILPIITILGACAQKETIEDTIQYTSLKEVLGAYNLEKNTLPITTDDVTLTIYTFIHSGAAQVYKDLSEHPVIKIMEEETGINLEFIHPPQNDDGTFFNAMIASQELPDIIINDFSSYPGGTEGAINDGVIINPNDLIAQYATNFKELAIQNLDRVGRDLVSDSGTMINFGNIIECDYLYGRIHTGLYVRDDLLDKYGLDMPITIEDYETVFKVMQNDGIAHPLGIPTITDYIFKTTNLFASAFDVPSDGFYINKNNKVAYSRIQPEYKEYLMLMNKWYEKRYISPNFISTSRDIAQKTFQAGHSGFMVGGCWEAPTINAIGGTIIDDFYAIGAPYPRQEEDDTVKFGEILGAIGFSGMQISSTCENPVEAVKFIDYLYNIDTANLAEWGPGTEEFPTFEIVDGKRVQTEFMTNNPSVDYGTAQERYKAINFAIRRLDEYQEQQYAPYPDKIETWKNWAYNTVNDGELSPFITPSISEARDLNRIMTNITTYTDEMTLKFIVGDTSFDEWDAYITQIEALGIEKATKITSEAYARYLNR